MAITGLVILLLAGDSLVRGAVNLGLRLGIPALIISLTVVALGTSAPELLIAVKAMLQGSPGIAIGNVVGSNTANILLVLGLPALLAGINAANCESRKTYSFMLATTLIFIAMSFFGPLQVWHGIVLLTLLAALLTESFFSARRAQRAVEHLSDIEDLEAADPQMRGWKIALFMVLGLIGLPLGADLLVEGSISIARHFGLSEAVIGLTLIAVGTSLPELATTLVAALRRHADVALGNAIGSNMFNILGIMGVASLFGPLHIPTEILRFDLWVMLGSSLILVPFVFWRINISRVWGAVLTVFYALYIVLLLS